MQNRRSEERAPERLTVNVTVQFSHVPNLRYRDAAVYVAPRSGGGGQEEFLAEVTAANRVLATEPSYILTE